MDNLYELSISEASSLLKRKELSPVDLVASHLLRIQETDDHLNSFITVLSDTSKKNAAQAEKQILAGEWKGDLHGIPIGLKDLYYTKGIPTTVGSKIYKDFIPDFDATVVSKLSEAGAIIIGKLQMHELHWGQPAITLITVQPETHGTLNVLQVALAADQLPQSQLVNAWGL